MHLNCGMRLHCRPVRGKDMGIVVTGLQGPRNTDVCNVKKETLDIECFAQLV